ncbi:prion-inhibition and propagation-domain-containing protein [Chaetomium sp. MPI-CAGE-AT-0009]|nr:prion-inhibition and propagation-domain-containing protein [Chaetomium sp. MPI-CAGE-AT-0009]
MLCRERQLLPDCFGAVWPQLAVAVTQFLNITWRPHRLIKFMPQQSKGHEPFNIMAEVAGLALGVAGLAGIIGAFKDAIDLFSLFLDSRQLGRDYEILDIKLDIEKALLLQWADRVGLLRGDDHDPQLDAPQTQEAISRSLACIRSLLGDASQLKGRYGIRGVEGRELTRIEERCADEALVSNESVAISKAQTDRFVRDFNAMRLRMRVIQANSAVLKKKVRWVIRDKLKFATLLDQLAYFTTALSNLTPPTGDFATPTREITPESLQATQDLRRLKIVLEASAGKRHEIAGIAKEAIDRTCQEHILQTLWFRTISAREENINTPHHNTFGWLLEPPTTETPAHHLVEWLRGKPAEGIYWVSGKAGSGKSTLMKFLYHHPRTQELLSNWVGGGGPCKLVSFFFWTLGEPEQKTQEGLSRSLLYQILSFNPSLIREALPGMWKEINERETEVSLPSSTEIKKAFRTFASESSSKLGKICFFIDGLDEFTGNYYDGIAFIKELSATRNFKVIVSSRPIPDCVAAFDGLPRLQLHHLTRNDITAYVHDVVGSHKYMQKLIARNRADALGLIEEVVHKSCGVFLWVILACRSLLSGFADYDRIDELKRRVEELPPELEEMFQLMLARVNPRHRSQGARLLRLCYTFHSSPQGPPEVREMSTLGLALLDDNRADGDYTLQLDLQDKRDLCEELDGRLRSRCGGLLEIVQRADIKIRFDRPRACLCGASAPAGQDHDPLVDGKVEFMHRTVFEFLDNQETWDLDNTLREAKDMPDITDAMSLYGLLLAAQCLGLQEERCTGWYLWQGLCWGRESDRNQDPGDRGRPSIFWRMRPFLDQVLESQKASQFLSDLALMHSHSRDSDYFSHATLILAVEIGAVNYARSHPDLQRMVNNDRSLCRCRPLFHHSCRYLMSMSYSYDGGWLLPADESGEMASYLVSIGPQPDAMGPTLRATGRDQSLIAQLASHWWQTGTSLSLAVGSRLAGLAGSVFTGTRIAVIEGRGEEIEEDSDGDPTGPLRPTFSPAMRLGGSQLDRWGVLVTTRHAEE